jgi:hypothetical protein
MSARIFVGRIPLAFSRRRVYHIVRRPIMAVKIKPVGASEIKDKRMVREVIAQVRKERTPEEWAAIREDFRRGEEFLKRAMGNEYADFRG